MYFFYYEIPKYFVLKGNSYQAQLIAPKNMLFNLFWGNSESFSR